MAVKLKARLGFRTDEDRAGTSLGNCIDALNKSR